MDNHLSCYKKKSKMTKYPMTLLGAEQLKEELRILKTEKRPRIVKDIADAREHGDLKENAEYHAAKEEQGFCEGRIQDIEGRLCNAQVIDITKIPNHGKVIFGTTVTLLNIDTEETVKYQIVGNDEANIKLGQISVNSPIARGLIGKMVDSEIEISTPGGVIEYEIMAVEHI
jgi:transcription elongation factor GreA